jgi:hypothetical protein
MEMSDFDIIKQAKEEQRPLTQEEVNKIREMRCKRQLEYWRNLNREFTVETIPLIPKACQDVYNDIIIPALIRCGAIPKSQLEIGFVYEGSCRNADKAVWNGFQFEYIRTKFGSKFKEKINHFEDDNGYDLFVPIKKLEKSQEL